MTNGKEKAQVLRALILTLLVGSLLLCVTAHAAGQPKSVDPAGIETLVVEPQLIRPLMLDGRGPEASSAPSGEDPAAVIWCNSQWQGGTSQIMTGWFIGDEQYAVYQDPAEYGPYSTQCAVSAEQPFEVTRVYFYFYAQTAVTFNVRAIIYDYAGPGVIGTELCSGDLRTGSVSEPGGYYVGVPISCTVTGPYYAALNFTTSHGTGVIDLWLDNGTTVPIRSNACYNDWGTGWVDMVGKPGYAGNLLIFSKGNWSLSGDECFGPDCVNIPDMVVMTNQQDVEIPIMVENSWELRGLVVPLTVETVSGSASITSARLEYRERLVDPILEDVKVCNQYELEDGTCKQGAPGGFGTITGSVCGIEHPVTSMPQGFLFSKNKIFAPNLPPGYDVIGSMVLVVDIGPDEGTLVVDTTCANPANHLLFVKSSGTPVLPLWFGSGVIRVVDACCSANGPDNRTGNVDQDPGNVKDLTDILILASYAFLSGDVPPCMAEMNTDGDTGCVYDLGDVLKLASYAYLGGDAPAYCLPECE